MGHPASTAAYFHHWFKKKKKKNERKRNKPLIQPVTHLQHVFIACCVCRPFTLWPHFFLPAKFSRGIHPRVWGFLLCLISFSPTFALWTPYFRLFCSPPQPHIHPMPATPSSRPFPPLLPTPSLPPPSLYPSCQWSWPPSRIWQMVQ